MRGRMWIFNFRKIFRFPAFGDDFIRDPVDIATGEQVLGYRIIETGGLDEEDSSYRESLRQWMDEEYERHYNPSDPASISFIDAWEH